MTSLQPVEAPARTITKLRAWSVTKPLAKVTLDLFVASLRMRPSEILTHQIQPRVEQVERCAERVDDG